MISLSGPSDQVSLGKAYRHKAGGGFAVAIAIAITCNNIMSLPLKRHEVEGCNLQSQCHEKILRPCDMQATRCRQHDEAPPSVVF